MSTPNHPPGTSNYPPTWTKTVGQGTINSHMPRYQKLWQALHSYRLVLEGTPVTVPFIDELYKILDPLEDDALSLWVMMKEDMTKFVMDDESKSTLTLMRTNLVQELRMINTFINEQKRNRPKPLVA
jgi:hypothetical protein